MTVDLRTRYLGLELRNPLVVSACPLTDDVEALRRFEAHGAAAAVFPSIFEEQIEREQIGLHNLYEGGTESFAEALSYLPDVIEEPVGPEHQLRRMESARAAVKIPLIGSLNGTTTGGWTAYARRIEETGVDALELNVYTVPTDPAEPGAVVEQRVLDLVAEVRAAISIPLAVKITPFFTATANLVVRLGAAGAAGVVLFNRFVHPDIDLEHLSVVPRLTLSDSREMLLPMMWIGLLHDRTGMSLAAGTGVHGTDDVLKLLLSGADVAMMASALYLNGPGHLDRVLAGVTEWMEEREYVSVEQMKGSLSQRHCLDPTAYERVNYMKMLASFTGGSV